LISIGFHLSTNKSTGGLIAAGITFGTAKMDSTWAWRIPSAVQGVFSIICIIIIPFIPESPRWLVYQNEGEKAMEVVAYMYADGDRDDPMVVAQFKEIMDTIEYEKNSGETLSMLQLIRTPSARKRVTLAVSAAVFSTIAGMLILSKKLIIRSLMKAQET
jgi:hypothetical protein